MWGLLRVTHESRHLRMASCRDHGWTGSSLWRGLHLMLLLLLWLISGLRSASGYLLMHGEGRLDYCCWRVLSWLWRTINWFSRDFTCHGSLDFISWIYLSAIRRIRRISWLIIHDWRSSCSGRYWGYRRSLLGCYDWRSWWYRL